MTLFKFSDLNFFNVSLKLSSTEQQVKETDPDTFPDRPCGTSLPLWTAVIFEVSKATSRGSHWMWSVKRISVLKISQNSQENVKACNFIKNETLAQVFSCKFCEHFKGSFLTESLRMSASPHQTRESEGGQALVLSYWYLNILSNLKCFNKFHKILS